MQQALAIGSSAITVGLLVDRLCYGHWTVPAINFYSANVSGGVSRLYGVHPWHWYWTEGFTAMLGTMIPYTIIGVCISSTRQLALVCGLVVAAYSLAPHKEFRFLHPVLPVAIAYAGHGAECLWTRATVCSAEQVTRTNETWSCSEAEVCASLY